MDPVGVAVRGKGYLGTLKRAVSISSRYGVSSRKIRGFIAYFGEVLRQYGSEATFPVPAVVLDRNKIRVKDHLPDNIELALHGYYHIDHSRLSLEDQLGHFQRSRSVFEKRGILLTGFRSPYLRWNEDTIEALCRSGFLYDCSQGLAWEVAGKIETEAYRHVLGFYRAVSAVDYPALPRWDKGLVRIPYCLPDDEALVERFELKSPQLMSEMWLAILDKTHTGGELFTLGLHPERILPCEIPLRQTLEKARGLSQGVWIARLEDIARWWKARTCSRVNVTSREDGAFHVEVNGPKGVTLLARKVELMTPSVRWDDAFQKVLETEADLRASCRPFIGVSPSSEPYLKAFLQQQGYIVEKTSSGENHAFFLDRPQFGYQDERPLLAQIEKGDFPLVRLARWPDAARSALSVTGDIEGFTVWDYGLRFLGK